MEHTFIVGLVRMATQAEVRPLKVAAEIPLEPADYYAEFFGVAVGRSAHPTVTFAGRDARLPFLTANEKMGEVFAPDLRRRLADLDRAALVAERVGAVLLEALPSGQATVDTVSDKLIMSKRTLQRRLHGEGRSFNEVLKNTRKELSIHNLLKSRMTSAEISFLLGFESSQSFFRAFHDWTRSTPEAIRRTGFGQSL